MSRSSELETKRLRTQDNKYKQHPLEIFGITATRYPPHDMPQDTLIDDRVSEKQAKLAVDALHKHAMKKQKEQEDTELLGAREEWVWLVVAVKKSYPEKTLKPFRM